MAEHVVIGFILGFLPSLVLGVIIGMSLYWRTGNW
jgi:ABC-type nitrate/sulfonate/bicarbonate transport system permease component